MRQKKTIPFEITSMDSLGQGVSKLMEKVAFIPKTIPGEKGEAEVLAERKGVMFARVISMDSSAKERIVPECVHFNSCSSCHYQHMNYQDELAYKKKNFEQMFRKLPLPNLEVIGASKRLHYRNRIQLHYSIKSKLLGLKDSQTHKILPVPHCLIAVPEVATELKRLYENDQWLNEVRGSNEGHVEIYFDQDKLKVTWNRPYSEGGFTQVFKEMNEKLKQQLQDQWLPEEEKELLDLFAGNGNLSRNLNHSRRLCVDIYKSPSTQDFFSQDLYQEKALLKVQQELQRQNFKVRHLLLDPPRSGVKNLAEWVDALRPEAIAYVSCDPHTLVRDLQSLTSYEIKKAFLIDFFPSTFHFESMVFLERKLL